MTPPFVAAPPPEAVPPTRSAASLVVTINDAEQGPTENVESSDYWPGGIDYSSIKVPAANLSEDADLRREVRDLFGDEDD